METWKALQEYLPGIRRNLDHQEPFGIGLRLSAQAARELLEKDYLEQFQAWLQDENFYVFTINGFPYGGFHNKVIKDLVHQPDWKSSLRLEYTQQLVHILQRLIPAGEEGGISTSPLSYRFWHPQDLAKRDDLLKEFVPHLLQLLGEMHDIYVSQNKCIHLDIEPEPDGLLENSEEFLYFFQQILLPEAIPYLNTHKNLGPVAAEEALKRHIRICYDICHFAVEYENHEEVLDKLDQAGVKIGKFQISSALKANFEETEASRADLIQTLLEFDEPTYLHQVVEKNREGAFQKYPDLGEALGLEDHTHVSEWRIHFHVPVFLERYGILSSTQLDIRSVFDLARKRFLSAHWEVETYTWTVLPAELKLDLVGSISRELAWVMNHLRLPQG